MPAIHDHIRALEAYVERIGARLVRTALPDCVHGRVFRDLITLRVGLTSEQELLALVHELAHWLAHRDSGLGLHCTLFEYEAEAVEQLVTARLGLPRPGLAPADLGQESPTDGLLPASVARVISASSRICGALGLEAERLALPPQAAVHVEAASGEGIVLEYKPHGASDILGSLQAL